MVQALARKHRSPAEVLAIVRSFNTSGMTKAAFAQKVGVNRNTLKNWIRDGGKRGSSIFAPVMLPAPAMSATLRLGDLVIELASSDPKTIAAVVRGIAGME